VVCKGQIDCPNYFPQKKKKIVQITKHV